METSGLWVPKILSLYLVGPDLDLMDLLIKALEKFPVTATWNMLHSQKLLTFDNFEITVKVSYTPSLPEL